MKVSVRLALFAIAALVSGACTSARAGTIDPYVVTMEQVGPNVVATGSGEFDLSGLTFVFDTYNSDDLNGPSPYPYIDLGAPVQNELVYTFPSNANDPSGFGTVYYIQASSGSGDPVGIDGSKASSLVYLQVPPNYQSGTLLNGSQTVDGATITGLGLIPGSYVWTWGSEADQGFTLDILAPTPLPAALPLFVGGLGLIGWFGSRRRPKAQAA